MSFMDTRHASVPVKYGTRGSNSVELFRQPLAGKFWLLMLVHVRWLIGETGTDDSHPSITDLLEFLNTPIRFALPTRELCRLRQEIVRRG